VVEHGRAVCAELDPSMPLWEMNGCDLFTAD
jgi:hypothetical protein